MSPIDACIVLVFLAYTLGAGLWSRRRAGKSLEEYFLAGRTLRGWQAGCSMAATQFAADTPLVVMGLIATAGVFGLWQLWSYGLAFLLLGFLFAPGWRRAGVLTDAELAELRYAGRGALWLRGARAFLFGVIFNAVVVAMVLFAAALFAESFLHFDAWLPGALFEPLRAAVEAVGVPFAADPGDPRVWEITASNLLSILLLTGVALFYSTTGGLRSVVATDVAQLALMLGATAIYAFLAVAAVGGLGGLLEGLAEAEAEGGLGALSVGELVAITPGAARDVGAGLVLVFALQWLLQRNADGTGYLAQRSMACRSDHDARVASVVFAFLQIGLRSLLWIPLGLSLLLLLPPDPELIGQAFTREREASFVVGMKQLLPVGVLGLMVTGMLAALMSTIDTHLNWGASYLANDLYGRIWCQSLRGREAGPRELVWVARISGVLLLGVSLLFMTQLGSIQQAWKTTLVLGAGLGTASVLRWLWWRLTAWGELAALVSSFVAAPLVLAWVEGEAARMLIGALVGTVAAVGVSLLGPAESPETLRRFAERVRPAGFFGPYGDGRGPRRLRNALVATGACGFTLLAGTAACVAILFPGPDAGRWLPFAVLILALAAVPFWWRALREDARGA
ncbi:MAG: sodium transporter [Myxococcota bacterium]|nr:sodium transporter [Myxococcota bacterium]